MGKLIITLWWWKYQFHSREAFSEFDIDGDGTISSQVTFICFFYNIFYEGIVDYLSLAVRWLEMMIDHYLHCVTVLTFGLFRFTACFKEAIISGVGLKQIAERRTNVFPAQRSQSISNQRPLNNYWEHVHQGFAFGLGPITKYCWREPIT